MDELIGQPATKAGIDNTIAEKTIGIMLGFLRGEGPSDKVQALIAKLAGAEAAIATAGSRGGVSKLMGNGMVAAGTRLMAVGLGIAHELFGLSRDKIGANQMGEIIAGPPGLSQFA
jgi:hypothetical protein